jgi:hypothetical protein
VYTSTTTSPPAIAALPQLCRAPRLLVTRTHGLYLNLAVRRDYSSSGCTGSNAPIACIRTRRLAAQFLVGRSHWLSSCTRSLRLVARLRCRLTCCSVAQGLLQQRRAPRLLVSRSHRLYITFVVHRDYSSPGRTSSTSTSPCAASTCLPATTALLQLRRASGCLGLSCGSPSTTSPTPCVRVPRHIARLVVDYSAYAARPDASAHRAAHRRLLRLRRASGCFGMSRSS